jgi:uncharacterized protein
MTFEIEGWPFWERQFAQFLAGQAAADVAHDDGHIQRVVAAARSLAGAEGAELAVVIPAAWLHDCISVPKDSPERGLASRLAAAAATAFLASIGYPAAHLAPIGHAIEAHSFSANLAPATLEARVVQDADRLDALGAIGIARCLMLGGALGRRLYDPGEPFPQGRPLDDSRNTIDHFYCKLLGLAERMQTAAGRAEAERRTRAMRAFLDQLESELSPLV